MDQNFLVVLMALLNLIAQRLKKKSWIYHAER